MNAFAKSWLAGLLVGGVAGLIAFGIASALVAGDDPARMALSAALIAAFFFGTLTCGISAARLDRERPYVTALLAALAFEAVLLLVARTGLSVRAIAIALVATAFLALIGAFIARPKPR